MASRKFQAYTRPVPSDDSEFPNLISKLHLSDEARAAIKAWAKTQPVGPHCRRPFDVSSSMASLRIDPAVEAVVPIAGIANLNRFAPSHNRRRWPARNIAAK